MTYFFMLVGLPGGGKSYCANLILKDSNSNTVLLESDAIRNYLFNDENAQWCHAEVFQIMRLATIANLKKGNDVIYDATNLSAKRRKALLEEVKKIPEVETECIVVITNIDTCIANDKQRKRTVGAYVIYKCAARFEVPTYEEGWDNIVFCGIEDRDKTLKFREYYTRKFIGYKQHNPYHNQDLLDHIDTAVNHFLEVVAPREKLQKLWIEIITEVLKWHDLGKPYAQQFDENGVAHYFGHEHISSYLFLSSEEAYKMPRRIKFIVAKLIELHMATITEKIIQKKNLTKQEVRALELIKECDKYRPLD